MENEIACAQRHGSIASVSRAFACIASAGRYTAKLTRVHGIDLLLCAAGASCRARTHTLVSIRGSL